MKAEMHSTLIDAVRPVETAFVVTVHAAVEHSLNKLGTEAASLKLGDVSSLPTPLKKAA